VTVAYDKYSRRTLSALYRAYKEYFTVPGKGLAWADTGAHQVLNIADAAASSGLELDSLTLAGATYQLWDPELRSEEEIESLQGLVRPLRRLQLYIQTERDVEDIEDLYSDLDDGHNTNEWADFEACAAFETGSVTEMLAEATDLRVLKLRLWHHRMNDDATADIENALGYLHFTLLQDLTVGDCTVEPQYLVDAILRHKANLRRLSLSRIHLLGRLPGGGWRSTLTAIAGQLPNLQKVRLSGYLTSMWGFDLNLQCPETRPQRAEVEDFVLKGGASPWNDRNRASEEFLRRMASETIYRMVFDSQLDELDRELREFKLQDALLDDFDEVF
jgi:hypothetical protein